MRSICDGRVGMFSLLLRGQVKFCWISPSILTPMCAVWFRVSVRVFFQNAVGVHDRIAQGAALRDRGVRVGLDILRGHELDR